MCYLIDWINAISCLSGSLFAHVGSSSFKRENNIINKILHDDIFMFWIISFNRFHCKEIAQIYLCVSLSLDLSWFYSYIKYHIAISDDRWWQAFIIHLKIERDSKTKIKVLKTIYIHIFTTILLKRLKYWWWV